MEDNHKAGNTRAGSEVSGTRGEARKTRKTGNN